MKGRSVYSFQYRYHCHILPGYNRRSGHYQDSFAKYRARNINVAVGTDTFPPDFFQNIRIASLVLTDGGEQGGRLCHG
ncbi:MAG: hypothetical protein ACLTBV_08295 [Enterocloster bolteae]